MCVCVCVRDRVYLYLAGSSFTLELPMQRRIVMREIRAQNSHGDASSCMSTDESVALYQSGSFDLCHQPTIDLSDTIPLKPVEMSKNTKLRLLVVDDSRLNRKMLIKCFTSDGNCKACFLQDSN